MLEMKDECLECHSELSHSSEAHVCSYECTYCDSCATDRNFICKNCGGANAYEADSTTAATANLTNHTSECVIKKILELINMETSE